MLTVTAEVDIGDVLEQLSTRDLVEELLDRAKAGDREGLAALGGHGLLLAAEKAIEALRAGRPERALELLTLGVDDSPADARASWEEARKGEHPFLIVRKPS
jgi:hypothetical protein